MTRLQKGADKELLISQEYLPLMQWRMNYIYASHSKCCMCKVFTFDNWRWGKRGGGQDLDSMAERRDWRRRCHVFVLVCWAMSIVFQTCLHIWTYFLLFLKWGGLYSQFVYKLYLQATHMWKWSIVTLKVGNRIFSFKSSASPVCWGRGKGRILNRGGGTSTTKPAGSPLRNLTL